MKTYTKPSVQTFEFFAKEMLAASPGGVATGSSAGKGYNSSDVDYSRQKNNGIGGGLWSDMQ